MVDKYCYLDDVTGLATERSPNTTSSGAADAGKIIATNASGHLDASFLSDLPYQVLTSSTNLSGSSPMVSIAASSMIFTLPPASTVDGKLFILTNATAATSTVNLEDGTDKLDSVLSSVPLPYAFDSLTVQAYRNIDSVWGYQILGRKFGQIPANYVVAGATGGTLIEPVPRSLVLPDVSGLVTNFAPKDPSYIVVTTSTGLTNERSLAVGKGLALLDGGAGSTLSILRDDSKTEWASQVNPATTLITVNTIGTTLVPTLDGTETAYSDSTGRWINHASTTLLNATAGWSSATFTHTQSRFNPIFTAVVKMGPNASDVSGSIPYVGLGDSDLSGTPTSYAMFYTQSTQWYAENRDSGNSESTATGITKTADTVYVFRIEMTTASIKYYINGVLVATHTDTSAIPAATQGLNYTIHIKNASAGTARNIRVKRVHCRQD